MRLSAKFIVVNAVVLLFAATIVGAFFTQDILRHAMIKTSNEVVLEHLSLLKSKDIEKAYDLTSKQFQTATTLREFTRFTDRYPIFNQYENVSVMSDLTDDYITRLKIELKDKSKNITKLDYDMVKDKGTWKIVHIMIKPMFKGGMSLEEKLADKFNQKVPVLTSHIDNDENRYSINYPASWMSRQLENGTIVLSGKQGTRAYYSTINIQTILSKKIGGQFETVPQLIDDIKQQVIQRTKNVIFLESGPYSVIDKNGDKAEGEYLIFTYSYNGNIYQQWDVVVSRHDGQVFYVWAYTSPMKLYHNYLPFAEAILSTWNIY